VGRGLETTGETLALTYLGRELHDRDEFAALCRRIECPVLVIHGTDDAVRPFVAGAELAAVTGASLVALEGSGHCPHARDPVRVNLLLRDIVAPRPAPRGWPRGRGRPKRALYVSSPIGLGHARRDIAIARELRLRHPGLAIEWLAQHPVTAALEAAGETVHPAGRALANESRHFESESAEHDLHCFQAWRRMDEILVANFMVFHDLVGDRHYDLWIADEGWEIGYYLHENPEEKRAAYAWLTDFVGYRHLAACDLAVVQAGLTTSMELTANRRPFISFPLRRHFEQNTHVRHRLERYGAGRRMDFETATPEVIADAIAEEIGREVDYRPVETGGAAVAAARIAELL
jgi:hypothetical protein